MQVAFLVSRYHKFPIKGGPGQAPVAQLILFPEGRPISPVDQPEIGMPRDALALALFLLNVGVESGQLLVVAGILALSILYVAAELLRPPGGDSRVR